MKTAELKVLPVSVLKPAEYNPRKKLKVGDPEYEKIKHSIEEFGFADPLVVKYMSLAGWDTAQMLSAIDGVVNLAAASDMDLAEASDMVTDYLSAFGLQASDSAKMVDEMVFAQSHSNTSTKQLGEAFGNCAANMNAAGQSMETTVAVLEAMANQGTKGSQAGTQLAAVMRDITSKMKNGAIQIGKTSVQVVIEENTSCDAAGTVIFYRPESDPSGDRIVAILPRGTTQTTVNVPDIKTASHTCFGAYAFLGTYEGLSVNALMRSGITLDSDIVSVPPEWVTVQEWTHSDSVRIGWPWSWSGANQAELSWADHEDAWESTAEPESYIIDNKQVSSWVISELETGKRWYFRVRLLYIGEDEEVTGPWSETISYNLSGIPDRPALSLSKAVINAGGSFTARWGFTSEDGTTQAYAEICEVVDNENIILAHAGEEQSMVISQDWETGTTHFIRVRTTSSSGRQSEWSDPVNIYVAEPVTVSMTDSNFENIIDIDPVEEPLLMIELPLTVTVTGAGVSGMTTVSIIRADDYHIYRPDEKDCDGYAGETIASVSRSGEGQLTITLDDLIGSLDNGARYYLSCSAADEYGQTAIRQYPFRVDWNHKAGIPGAEVKVDRWQRIAVITPIAPGNFTQGDVCDIYRLSADAPELIFKGAEFGVSYVDPYPAFGDFCGHRLVTRTANGDYATADGALAWFDAGVNVGDVLLEKKMVIDVDGDQISLPYNIELSNNWNKDFERTAYLGGSVQGDWNPAITRDMTANTVILRGRDLDRQLSMRDLAGYAGIAHIRTPDGSSLAADIQVNETYSYQNKRVTYTLAIKAIDPQGMDGMTLAQWLEMHPDA